MNTTEELNSGKLIGAKQIKIKEELTEFPIEILHLADTLEILDLSGNQLTMLPNEFQKLQKLKIAFFSDNNFKEFPKILSQCPSLEMIAFKANQIEIIDENSFPENLKWLILTNNKLKSIPTSIGKCTKLQKCMLAGNQINYLPQEMENCTSLQLLRISANNLTIFPSVVYKLPNLAWLALSGNPFSKLMGKLNPLLEVEFEELEILEILGEGASGYISKAKWKEKPIALKIFKGEITSDGLPEDEMRACIEAGSQINLIPILGKVKNHPKQKQGLLLELLDPQFKTLGLPPTFETCTRDVFPNSTFLTLKETIAILIQMASSCLYLHQKGIMHGDFYAHNILYNGTNKVYLSDFGAATIYDRSKAEFANLEKIEIKAFGYFIEDLLKITKVEPEENIEYVRLNDLKISCLYEDISSRPSFQTTLKSLNSF